MEKKRTSYIVTYGHKNSPAPKRVKANGPGEHSPSQCTAHNSKNSKLDEFLKNFGLSENQITVQDKILDLHKGVANEDPEITKSWSLRSVVEVITALVVVGYGMRTVAGIPLGWSCWTYWLKYGGILVSAVATVVAAFIGWERKRDLAKIQLKLDALDIWEKSHPIKAKLNSENNIERREAYLLKQSYVNTVLWGLGGVTILSAFAAALG
ncbi:hypothetical protein [Bifidobacterium mellis]|uniref:hypothetical protein n=1 Tax=Bifidobacterium mellis TaxID=1293823 RepID=UPI0012DFF3B6|nr:hypothetical protein [Bifidobacterium mellis]